MPVRLMECGVKCRSRQHAYEINAAITKGNLAQVQSYSKLCYNGAKLSDMHKRSALHMAASCGKVDIVEWLLEERNGDVTQKDRESGWTALHRAVFYGYINTARILIQFKSDLYTRDNEGLGPLDIVMKDRKLVIGVPPPLYEMRNDRQEVCTWGDNSNFTLGHKTEHRRQTPEAVDVFRKLQIAMKQIVMCKYHTVFLSTDGSVYTCGHGLGGRLGHHTEETCLVPHQVETLKTEECVEVAASRDHTLFLSDSGAVYSCGMNDSQQLGQQSVPEKCLLPKQVYCKGLKGKTVLGLGAGRFHSLIYTSSSVYTCGLNAGQLGHPKQKGDRKVSQLKQVSALNVKDLTIVSVKCSDAATVVLTKDGEMYVLHEYQCRKITSNRCDIQCLCIVGGNLDHTDSQILRENGGRELIISYLNTSGKVFIWHEKSPSLKRACWLIRRQLDITDFVLTESGMALVTDQGEVFLCTLSGKTPPPVKDTQQPTPNKESVEGEFGRMSLMELLSREEVLDVQVRKVANVHRAMYITADRKGSNYATLQSLPNACLTDVPSVDTSDFVQCFSKLLDEVDEYDLIHDLILQVNQQRWPVHKFILVSRCANFPSLLVNSPQTNNEMDVPVVDIALHPQILEQVLQFVYTDFCDLLTVGAKFTLSPDDRNVASAVTGQTGLMAPSSPLAQDKHEDIFHMDLGDGGAGDGYIDGRKSAYQVIQGLKQSDSSSNSDKDKKGKKEKGQSLNDRNPLKLLLDVARKWGVKGLVKRIGCVNFSKGQIHSAGKTVPKTCLKFDRNKLRDTKWELYDVMVKSEDGIIFQCHRSVLVARLEYFHSMLALGWKEASSDSALSLAIPGDILEVLLEYLYTDHSQLVYSSQNVELLCNILVVADQMLVNRLKQHCETAIAVLLTMKNVGEILEFCTMYNAHQLKATCQQFIVLNLPAMLEGHYLDVLSDDVIDDLSRYYRNSIPNMSRRLITPHDAGPSSDYLEELVTAESSETIEKSPGSIVAPLDVKKSKTKRKRLRTKSSADEGTDKTERGARKISETEKSFERLGDRKSSECGNAAMDTTARRVSERCTSISSDISIEEMVLSMELMDTPTEATSPTWPSAAGNRSKSQPSQQSAGSQSVGPQSVALQSIGPWIQTTQSQPEKLQPPLEPGKPTPKSTTHTAATSCPTNLRDIINEEQTKSTSPKSSGKKAGKFSWKDVKKQQQKVPTTPKLPPDAPANTNNNNNSTKACPWASTNKEVQSFRSLMDAEQETTCLQKSKTPAVATPSKTVNKSTKSTTQSVSWGLPKSSKSVPVTTSKVVISPSTNPSKPAWGAGSVSPQSPDFNPWLGVSPQSPIDNICSFTEIVKHEQHKTDVLTKTANKPLHLIQIEEQAIQDLLQHYKATSNVDEHISVERVTYVSATPVWKRERLQSS